MAVYTMERPAKLNSRFLSLQVFPEKLRYLQANAKFVQDWNRRVGSDSSKACNP